MRRTITAIAATITAALTLAPTATATPETDYLDALTDSGYTIYDTSATLNIGYLICDALYQANGEQVARAIYLNGSNDVPTIDAARIWVIVAAGTLCPQHIDLRRMTT